MRIHLKRFFKNYSTDSGATHHSFSLEESLHYITHVFYDYQTVSEQKNFFGKICELGPGDSNGVALAAHVDLPDRFYALRNLTHQNQISKALIHRYPSLKKISATLNSKCSRYYGEQACGERFFKDHKSYDFIVSRSTLEHTDDPENILFTKLI